MNENLFPNFEEFLRLKENSSNTDNSLNEGISFKNTQKFAALKKLYGKADIKKAEEFAAIFNDAHKKGDMDFEDSMDDDGFIGGYFCDAEGFQVTTKTIETLLTKFAPTLAKNPDLTFCSVKEYSGYEYDEDDYGPSIVVCAVCSKTLNAVAFVVIFEEFIAVDIPYNSKGWKQLEHQFDYPYSED